MNTLRERLALALTKKRGGSQAGLARACGIKQPSVAAWMNGRTKQLKANSLLRAAAYLGVRTEWLDSGRGPMYEDSADARSQAEEPAASWESWPFARLTAAEWGALTLAQRAEVEALALKLVLMTPPAQRDGTYGP